MKLGMLVLETRNDLDVILLISKQDPTKYR